jgi:hypothetical protein
VKRKKPTNNFSCHFKVYTEKRKQKTENRKQKTENRKQKTENRKQKTENRKQKNLINKKSFEYQTSSLLFVKETLKKVI